MALSEYVRPIAYCEINTYCQAVLLSRMANGSIPKAPIWDDVQTLQAIPAFSLLVDIIYGGFPCQDISIAGHGKGLEGERSRLFFEIVRLAKEMQPAFLFLENVPAITSRGGLRVVREIAEIGYDCRWAIISAASVGAPHKRERWFLLANANHDGSLATEKCGSPKAGVPDTSKGSNLSMQSSGMDNPRDVATKITSDTESIGMHESRDQIGIEERQPESLVSRVQSYWQETEPPICGMDDGPSHRVDRIRALGNAVVPQCAKKAFEYLMGLKNATNHR